MDKEYEIKVESASDGRSARDYWGVVRYVNGDVQRTGTCSSSELAQGRAVLLAEKPNPGGPPAMMTGLVSIRQRLAREEADQVRVLKQIRSEMEVLESAVWDLIPRGSLTVEAALSLDKSPVLTVGFGDYREVDCNRFVPCTGALVATVQMALHRMAWATGIPARVEINGVSYRAKGKDQAEDLAAWEF